MSKTPWRGPLKLRRKRVDKYGNEETPRCRCGNAFPFDTHPQTGEKICGSCYKAAAIKDWIVDISCRFSDDAQYEIWYFHVVALSPVTARLRALEAAKKRQFSSYSLLQVRTLEEFTATSALLS